MSNKYQGIPTHEEFMAYVMLQGWNDWADELWEELERTKWLTNKGTTCSNWHVIANARNGVIMSRLGIVNKKKHKSEDIVINQITEEFPDSEMHYICYTDGYCNELEEAHNGGAAYVIFKNGEIIKRSNKGFLNTKNYRMEMLSIISAVKSCPNGAFVDIYTDSTFTIKVLSKTYAPNKNADLYDLFNKYKANLADVRFHWLDKTDENPYSKMAHDLALDAYAALCNSINSNQ